LQPFAPDLKDASLYERGVPHEIFARLRREQPVYWNPERDGAGFWAITRYADIVEISRQPAIFSSAHRHGGHRIFNENEDSIGKSGDAQFGIPFISMDPPEHQQVRVVAMRGVSPTRLAGIEARISQRVEELMANVDAEGVEFVEAFAAPLPLLTLAELLDLPSTMWRKLYDWTNCFIGEDDPEFRRSPAELAATLQEFFAFARDLYDSRRRNPGADIVSALVTARFDGATMDFRDFLGNLVLILVGGNETTRNSISHSLVAFAENPAQWQRLRRQPELMDSALREMVRYANPVFHMRRTALRDVEIGGQRIRAGDKVVLWYISGNRDEAVFSDPYAFDIGRAESRHIGFGTGQHLCIGSRLAELQLRIAFDALLRRFSEVRVTRPPRRVRSNFINGLKALHLQFGQ
jgi:linalool 8-monooxygenase